MASATVESYVKTVYRLSQVRGDRPVTTGHLAEAMGVSPGTVTSMLKTLDDLELANYTPYEGVHLTEAGQKLALRIFRRHRLLEAFFCRALDLPWDKVHDDAERMEHPVSDFLIDRIDEYLGHPKFDPHGDPIPDADGTVAASDGKPLVDCPAGTQFRLTRVADQSPGFLRYLTQTGLSLGVTGSVRSNRLDAGILVLDLDGHEVTLSREVAGNLVVAPLETTRPHGGGGFTTTEPFLTDTATSDTSGAAR